MVTDRLDWTIKSKNNIWIATNDEWDIAIVARTKAELMSQINRWEKSRD